MGDAASLVDSLEIQPVRRIIHQEIHTAPHTSPNTPPGVEEPPPPPRVAESDDTEAAAPEPPDAPEPLVIGIPPPPRLPKFTMTAEQRATINEIAALGTKLGQQSQAMSPDELKATQNRLQELQKNLSVSMNAAQAQWRAQFDDAEKKRQVFFNARQQQREKDRQDRQRTREQHAEAPAPENAVDGVTIRRKLTDAEKQRLRANERQTGLIFGQRFNVPLRNQGAIVGQISAQVSTQEVVRRVLGAQNDDTDEITFAVDRDNNVYTRTPDDRKTLDRLGITDRVLKNHPLNDVKDWIVVMSRDPLSGLRVGVARPVGDNLEELRKTAGKNFGYGIALIFVAMIGIVPIANHMTRDVNLVTRGAERIAQGDLMTRLPVKSNNEIGQLAAAFNRMAQDLSLQQQTIVEQERTRKEQEIQRMQSEIENVRSNGKET
jgi:HAMP domain-containing protein